jgi:hypothetical protein
VRELKPGLWRTARPPTAPRSSGRLPDEPPICPACGVTMVPAALSARDDVDDDWVCLECEETDEP